MAESGEVASPAGAESDPRSLWGPEEFRTLAYASAIGSEFDFGLLARSLEREPEAVAEQLERLVREGVLRERPGGDRFAFTDEGLRGRIYRSLAESRVRVIHRRIGAAMERESDPPAPQASAELGRHFFLGRVPEKSVSYNRAAARLAREERRREEAIHHLERARADLEPLRGDRRAELVQLNEELGALYQSIGNFSAAEEALEVALRHLREKDRASRARLLLQRADLAWESLKLPAAERYAAEALILYTELGDLNGAASVHRVRSRIAAERGDALVALDEGMNAFELLRRTGEPGAAGKAGLEIASAFARLGPEMREEAVRWYDRAIRLLESTGEDEDLVRATLLLADLVGPLDAALALEHLARVRTIAERMREPRWEAWSYLNGTDLRLRRGEIEEAERETRLAARIFERAPEPAGAPAVGLSLGLIAERKGQWEQAEEEFRRSAEKARELGLAPQRAEAEFRLAQVRFKIRALEGAREAYRAASQHRLPQLRPALAPAFKALGAALAGATEPDPAPEGRGPA